MKDFWQKLTIAWPLVLSDGFWTAMTFVRESLMELTPRRLVLAFAFAALVIAMSFAQVGALDMLLTFAADLTLYFDVVSFAVLLAVQRHVRTVVRAASTSAQTRLRRGLTLLVRLRSARPRALRPRRASSGGRNDPSPDGPGWWGAELIFNAA